MWKPEPIVEWLITEGRLLRAPADLTLALCERLTAAGAPLWRVRFAPQLANPLLRAWGVVWRRDEGRAREYQVEHGLEQTGAYLGSPFQHVIERREPFRRRLIDLEAGTDHQALHDVAADGGTDFLALPMLFNNGSAQGISFATDRPSGFHDHDVAGLKSLTAYLTPVIEALAASRSTASLLRTYLGKDPAAAVLGGAVKRGDVRTVEAVVLMADLRGFTAKSLTWQTDDLLSGLAAYFEAVCDAVAAHGGDVLKFVGDGLLAIFPVADGTDPAAASRAGLAAARQAREALEEVNRSRQADGQESLKFVASLHRGALTYGNIGGRDRLDFTVIGPAVNVASRLQALCKQLDVFGLASASVATLADEPLTFRDEHLLPGVSTPVPVFEIGA